MHKEIYNYFLERIEEQKLDESIKNLVLELSRLDERYQVEIQNRKEILFKIKSILLELSRKTDFFDHGLNKLYQTYAYRDVYIDDYVKVMNLIVTLANLKEDNYELKELYASKVLDPNGDPTILRGRTLIIANKTVTELLDKKVYDAKELGDILKSFIEYYHSVVVITQNFCNGEVKPMESSLKKIEYKKIRNGGFAGDISCYLYDDELKNAVNLLIDYINEYGPDFRNIDVDNLVGLVSNKAMIKMI